MEQQAYRLLEAWITGSASETRTRGAELGQSLAPGSVVIFTGNLGAGKTTLIQGICTGLGVTEKVTSPTFTLINEYQGRLPVYHFDFYRLHTAAELIDLGVDEYLDGPGVCLVEWPELIEAWLPQRHLRCHLSHGFAAAELITTLQHEQGIAALPITAEVRLLQLFRHEPEVTVLIQDQSNPVD